MLDYHITQEMRKEYIGQNLAEIKKQISQGEGYHLASLAFLSGCRDIEAAGWSKALQGEMEGLYDASHQDSFDAKLQNVIHKDSILNKQCKTLG